MGHRFVLALRSSLFAFFLVASIVSAAEVPWQPGLFQYTADRKDLKDVLRDFASSQHVLAWISPEVSGNVSGRFQTRPQTFLNTLAGSFGFVWYFDGSVLWVWGANEIKTVTLDLAYANVTELRSSLQRMGIEDHRFPIHYESEGHAAIVSGPPGYVDRIAAVARSVDRSRGRLDGTEVRVFPLRYARAADRVTTIAGRDNTMPGVVSLLRGIYGANTNTTSGGGSANASRRLGSLRGDDDTGITPITPVDGQGNEEGVGLPGAWFGLRNNTQSRANPPLPQGGINANEETQATGNLADAGPALPQNSGNRSGGRGSAPNIQADPRTNTVIVRDRPERMSSYASLIEQLDGKPALLQIDATIIEVREGAMRDLGLNWRSHNSHLDVQTGTTAAGGLTYPATNANLGESTASSGANGGVLTAVLGDAGRYLMTRVNALEENNQAKIVSSPKVTTLDNVEAVMDQRERFFVRVSGYQSADLYGLSAGVSLRVLPTVVPGQGNTQIRLEVRIEDGRVTSQTVDSIPVISSSEITTQAFIHEGESLLIAGYENTDDNKRRSGVPGLSRIPGIGRLFQRRIKERSNTQRLFLLTPHLVMQ